LAEDLANGVDLRRISPLGKAGGFFNPGDGLLVLGDIGREPGIKAKLTCLLGEFFQVGCFTPEFHSTVVVILVGLIAGIDIPVNGGHLHFLNRTALLLDPDNVGTKLGLGSNQVSGPVLKTGIVEIGDH